MKRATVLVACGVWVVCGLVGSAPIRAAEAPVPALGEELSSLPRYMTAEERLLPFPYTPAEDYSLRSPPTGQVRCPPEYETCTGLFMAWESYTNILTEMAYWVTTADPQARVYMVVDSAAEQTSAYNSMNGAGVNMGRVDFIVRTTDTVWIRDYGPRFIFEDGARAIIDHTYNRPRPNDDAFNDYLAGLWGIPQYDIPLTHGGGNFHLFSNGEAFMTSLILTENPGLTAQDVQDLYADYQNLDLTIYTGFPTSFDSTQHIDMWMMPLADYKVIIGQYSSSTGQPYTITENAVTDLTGRGYMVYRTPGWNSGGTHYTYTNAVVINQQVFISKFMGSYATQDAQALAVYQSALPTHSIRQIYNGDIISAAGAMHCIVMHVPPPADSPIPSVRVLVPNGGETWYGGEQRTISWSAHDNVAVTSLDIYLSTDGGATWPHVLATGEPNDGVFTWTVPTLFSAQCQVKAIAYDADLNSAEDASDANFTISPPLEAAYVFPLDSNPGWTTSGAWAWGNPTGGGSHGRDPQDGYTGANVCGYNLLGDYPNNLPVQYLTTGALDCSDYSSVELRFRRWLGVEWTDRATLEVSSNGLDWTLVWQNPTGTSVNDLAWSLQTYSLAAVADGQSTVFVRWGMGPTDTSTTYPGWNLDDVEIWGVPWIGSACDVNRDGSVDLADYTGLEACLAGPAGALPAGQAVPCSRCDLDDDGDADLADFAAFQGCYEGQ